MPSDSADPNHNDDVSRRICQAISEKTRELLFATIAGLHCCSVENEKENLCKTRGLVACSLGVGMVVARMKSVLTFIKELPHPDDDFVESIVRLESVLATLCRDVNATLRVSGLRVEQSMKNGVQMKDLGHIPKDKQASVVEYRRRYQHVTQLVVKCAARLHELSDEMFSDPPNQSL